MRLLIYMMLQYGICIRGISYIPKFITNPLALWLYTRGVVPFRWKRLSGEFITDMFKYKHTSWKQKLWAYKRGFLSERINRYKLTDGNYTEYLSDIEFYNYRSYKNTRLSRWFDDKITTYYILQPYKEYLPIHYCWIVNGSVKQLDKTTKQDIVSISDVLLLLETKKCLAVKHTRFSRSIGFHKLSFDNVVYQIDTKIVDKNQMATLLTEMDDTIVTEYVTAHSSLRQIYSLTPNALRLVAIVDPDEAAQLTGAQIRFGTTKTGFVENAVKGAIFAGIRISDGEIVNPMIEQNMIVKPCMVHPDNGQKIQGKVPHWDLIVDKILEIANYLNHTPYLSFDIVCTEDGFKLLEINSHGLQSYVQINQPFFNNEYQKKLFSIDARS